MSPYIFNSICKLLHLFFIQSGNVLDSVLSFYLSLSSTSYSCSSNLICHHNQFVSIFTFTFQSICLPLSIQSVNSLIFKTYFYLHNFVYSFIFLSFCLFMLANFTFLSPSVSLFMLTNLIFLSPFVFLSPLSSFLLQFLYLCFPVLSSSLLLFL